MTPGHDIMITHPNELAEVLLRIAVSNSTLMQLIHDIVTHSYQPKISADWLKHSRKAATFLYYRLLPKLPS